MNKELVYKRQMILDEDSCDNGEDAATGICTYSLIDYQNPFEEYFSVLPVMTPSAEVATSSAIPQTKRIRKLKTSSSVSGTMSQSPNLPLAFEHSVMLDNADLSHESLKAVRATFLRHLCCPDCSSFGHELVPVENVVNVVWCPSCDRVYGLDDSINFFDLINELRSEHYTVEACQNCGNADANLFAVEFSGDSCNIAVVRCMKCPMYLQQTDTKTCSDQMVVDSTNETSTESDQCDFPFFAMIECKCPDEWQDIHVMEDAHGIVTGYKCITCNSVIKIRKLDPVKCTCSDSSGHDMMFDQFGYVDKIICSYCQAELSCELQAATPTEKSAGEPCGRTRVDSLSILKRGDHIAWHQFLSYWHHAIITGVDEANESITVIHYNGPNSHKGKVVEEEMPIDVTKTKHMYRIDYRDSDCYHPDEVIKRARTRLGETKYGLLSNNCEHFACWSKTNRKRSNQSRSFLRTVGSHLYNGIVGSGVKWLASSKGSAWLKFGSRAITATVDVAPGSTSAAAGSMVSGAASDVTAKEVASVAAGIKLLPATLVVLHEIRLVCGDIRNAHKQRSDGHITREEFIKITIKRTSEGAGSLAGVALAVAIPFTRNTGSITLASLIGKGIGCFVGRQLSTLYDETHS